MAKILILVLFFGLYGCNIFAETIILKSGRVVEAEIVKQTDDYIRVDFRGASLTYYFDEIESINGKPVSLITQESSLSKTSQPLFSTKKQELLIRIRSQLKKLHYPKESHSAIKRELMAFFEEINFYMLKSRTQYVKNDPDKLKEFAQEIGSIFKEQGMLNYQSPRLLIRLLVDSFGDDDMFAIINQSSLSPEKKKVRKRLLYGCSALSQLAEITFDLMGLPVKTLFSKSYPMINLKHSTSYVRLGSNQILLFDFINHYFKVIDLDYWYEQEGELFVLKIQHRLSSDRLFEARRKLWQDALPPTEVKEVLNLFFFILNLNDYSLASALICNHRGVIYREEDDLSRAIFNYDQALEINPNYAGAYANRGFGYVYQDNFQQAISDFNQALRINPNHARAYEGRGLVYEQKGDLSRAISDFDRALSINPLSATAYNNRGIAYEKKGNLSRAIFDYSQALRIAPDSVEFYFNRGLAYEQKGDLSRAISDYSQALRIAPDSVEFYFNRGLAYEQKGDLSRAISDFNQILRIDSNNAKAYLNRGFAYKQKGNLDQAISDYNQALRISPNFAEVYARRGSAYGHKRDLSRAISDYSQALRIDPNLEYAYFNRGFAYMLKGDFDWAISDFNQVLRIDPSHAGSYDGRGLAYKQKGDLTQAISNFNRALKINPRYVDVYVSRGLSYRQKGDLDQAISDFNRALEINPNYARAYHGRAFAYADQGNYAYALEDAYRAQELGFQVNPEFIQKLRRAKNQ